MAEKIFVSEDVVDLRGKKPSSSPIWTWHMMYRSLLLLAFTLFGLSPLVAKEPGASAKLVAHWPLRGDTQDVVGAADGQPEHITFGERGAVFNGRDGRIRVPASPTLDVGTRDFSITAWVRCETPFASTLGDLVSKFDPAARRGINLHVSGSSPAYSAMSDTRHVHFGIDDGYLGKWQDHGKPCESNSLISNIVAYEGELYCGIADADRPEDRAHVYRFGGDQKWIDCGRLGSDPNHNSVMSMIVHDGKLVAGTGIWDWMQAFNLVKGLPPAAPTHVFQYEGGTQWKDLGQVGNGTRVLCLASFQGELYAGLDSVGGGHAFKYDGKGWIDCGAPDGKNFECLLPWGGTLYGSTHGNIYEYQGGQQWKRIGTAPHDIVQIHSMQVYGGKVLLGTWPQGYVLRQEGLENWVKIGRLGLPEGPKLNNEVMDLTVYNGKLYAGLIPLAEMYRYERDGEWTQLGSLAKRSDWNVDTTATWTRVTCLSAFQGRLFAGTGSCQGRALDAMVDASLGRVFSIQAGQVVSHEHDIGGAWTHLAAVRRGRKLELHVNGKLAATSALRDGPLFDLTNASDLWIGFGAQNFFHGELADLRWYDGALDEATIQLLASDKKTAWMPKETFVADEARQAAAADERFVYAITNTQVAKYNRQTGERIAVSTGEAVHLNSGLLKDGKLYCAHSNYPATPERNEIKVLDPETMQLSTLHDFGDFGGSLTWVLWRDGHWWCNFARYGADNRQTFLVKLTPDWKEQGRWTYPSAVIRELGRFSLSGGVWYEDELLVTGHDDPVIFRLRLPKQGTVLELIGTQAVPFTGQGIAHDPKTGGLVGIDRKQRQVIIAVPPAVNR